MSTTTRITVMGMTCGHCSSAVTEELQGLTGVTEVAVDLVAGGSSPVTIVSQGSLDRDDLVAAVAEAGDYTVAF
ncbi:MAG TPA: heavy-metal-associated domain-containing protein [Dermatophilaceae bacterium]|nr:heavy-metal-associated domain-containing protein [Dermatophilaceae bacterium]